MDSDVELERNRIRNQIQKNEDQLQACRLANASIDSQIVRLKAASTEMANIRGRYFLIKHNERYRLLFRIRLEWKGNRHVTYKTDPMYARAIYVGIEEYYKDLGKIQDSIDRRIRDLERQKFSNMYIENISLQNRFLRDVLGNLHD